MKDWNLADCLDLIAEIRAEEDALVQGERRLCWRDVERRADPEICTLRSQLARRCELRLEIAALEDAHAEGSQGKRLGSCHVAEPSNQSGSRGSRAGPVGRRRWSWNGATVTRARSTGRNDAARASALPRGIPGLAT